MKILAMGDSHSRYFGVTPQLRTLCPGLAGVQVELATIHGATIAGFGKRASTLGTRTIVADAVRDASPDFLLLNFGQVDVELGIPYRRYVKRESTSVEQLTASFIESYCGFIQELDFPNNRIFVKGANLSVLAHDRNKAVRYIMRIVTDNIESPEEQNAIVEKMKSTFPTDIERASLVRYVNSSLANSMAAIGVSYFDLNASLRDPSTGLISADFIPTGRDHHLVDSIAVRRLHWLALLTAIEEKGSFPSYTSFEPSLSSAQRGEAGVP